MLVALVVAGVTASRGGEPTVIPEGETLSARCVAVHDGDTLTLLKDGRTEVKVRLDGIDAPELGQPFSRRSKESLSRLVFGKECSVLSMGADRYRRTIGRVSVEGVDVNLSLIREGLAWHYSRYDDREEYRDAERLARAARLGLWADARPIAPWDWRRLDKERRDALRAVETAE